MQAIYIAVIDGVAGNTVRNDVAAGVNKILEFCSLIIFVPDKADRLLFDRRRFQEPFQIIIENGNIVIVLIYFSCQLLICSEHVTHPNERTHNVYIDKNGSFAAQYA